MITGADEALAAHQRVAEAMWRDAVKGPAAAQRIKRLIDGDDIRAPANDGRPRPMALTAGH